MRTKLTTIQRTSARSKSKFNNFSLVSHSEIYPEEVKFSWIILATKMMRVFTAGNGINPKASLPPKVPLSHTLPMPTFMNLTPHLSIFKLMVTNAKTNFILIREWRLTSAWRIVFLIKWSRSTDTRHPLRQKVHININPNLNIYEFILIQIYINREL